MPEYHSTIDRKLNPYKRSANRRLTQYDKDHYLCSQFRFKLNIHMTNLKYIQ